MILAYYGGTDGFDPRAMLHCALGITFLSPAIRDATSWVINPVTTADPMVGEVRDVFYAARFLHERLGLRPEQIGLFGGSHGGGVVLRALTALRDGHGFPDNERIALAFGIAQSPGDKEGVLDPQHRHFRRDSAFFAKVLHDTVELRSRLPFAQLERLRSPLLVWQGTADPTVPIADTRRHVARARTLGLPLEFIELDGEGHNFGTLQSFVDTYRAEFAFIDRVIGRRAMRRDPRSPPSTARTASAHSVSR
jgi:dipeptidyl aminopeptidase/acylaminoacyl peptidase